MENECKYAKNIIDSWEDCKEDGLVSSYDKQVLFVEDEENLANILQKFCEDIDKKVKK